LLAEGGQRDQGRHELALVYDRFTEGFETAGLRTARQLMKELAWRPSLASRRGRLLTTASTFHFFAKCYVPTPGPSVMVSETSARRDCKVIFMPTSSRPPKPLAILSPPVAAYVEATNSFDLERLTRHFRGRRSRQRPGGKPSIREWAIVFGVNHANVWLDLRKPRADSGMTFPRSRVNRRFVGFTYMQRQTLNKGELHANASS
jgi:hypothetical protein